MCVKHRAPARRTPRRRGATATEIAIILPLFITLVLGCVDFGRFAYNYIAVTNAARAAASYAMMNPPDNSASPAASWQSAVTQRAINEMSSQPGVQSGSLTTSVAITIASESPYGTWQFSTTASYPFQTLIPWNFSMFGTTLGIPSSLTLSKTVTMRGIRP